MQTDDAAQPASTTGTVAAVQGRFWQHERHGSLERHGGRRFGPVSVGYSLYLHRYPAGDKRLVVHPKFFVDFGRRRAH